ncbi:MAG: MurR/RpiR family transcriptional regulator [Acholeplasmatales bacterium]|nr:MurR/RpiR family transcriptional regulator [Acholeplasmataceae bacterium]MDY0115838.1 MurR/RpiR family transcriptional regulator [Acholeplasmatales bacterium]MCK9234393.1 MurR/RpiR family transcriptional regulator [Acholeplasmataceae bacterium]MCK9289557.1 MurR/RpiR family transcriptional regulator [Acholeplasmataceae bacterium]MCK9427609.1 MurR/RpiR family transcriptional regulator [Acholeplasmataceae bacterium]
MTIMINMLKERENLSPSEKSILDYLVANKGALKDLSVESVAKASFTSPASVVRMAKKLGYSGFKDFKVDFILANTKIEIPSDKEYKDIILVQNKDNYTGKTAIKNNIRALEDTIRLYSENEIRKAAQMIMTSRKILIFGKGSSYLAAKDFQLKLRRIDRFCIAQEELHEQLVDATFTDERDVVIFISNSGETEEIIQAALAAKDNKAKIISIVKAGKSSLGEIAEINLYTSALEGEFRSAAMTSRISQLSVVDALFTECAYYDLNRSIRKLEKTYKTFKRHRDTKKF